MQIFGRGAERRVLGVVLRQSELQGAVGVRVLESDRKREILVAEARFERRQKLSARLAEAGVHVIGPLNPGPDEASQIPEAIVAEPEFYESDRPG